MTAANPATVTARADGQNGMYWLATEFEASLARVRSLLEEFSETQSDAAPLKHCVAELHQLRGIASVVQCHGAFWLADEMKRSAQALARAESEDTDATLTGLMGASVQLSDYLDLLSGQHSDALLVFQPTINELRLARGVKAISEARLLANHLREFGDHAHGAAPEAGDHSVAIASCAKLQPPLHAALVSWAKGRERTDSLKRIGKIVQYFSSVMSVPALAELSDAVAGAAEALLGLKLSDGLETKRLLGQASQAFKQFGQSGLDTLDPAAVALVAHQLVFHVFTANPGGARAQRLARRYRLHGLLPDRAELDEMRAQMRGPNVNLFARVAEEVREDLASAKDDIDLIVRTGAHDPDQFESTLGLLKRVSDTLSMLGLGPSSQLVDKQISKLDDLKQAPATDPRWMDAASALLLVEHTLEELLAVQMHDGQSNQHDALDMRSPPQLDMDDGTKAALRECLVNVSLLKGYLSQYVESGEPPLIDVSRSLLHQIGAVLVMVQHPDAAAQLGRLESALAHQNFVRIRTNPDVSDAIADAVAAMEWFLEAVHQRLPQFQPYLDAMCVALETIHARLEDVQDAGSAAAASPGEAPAPTDDQIGDDAEFREIFVEEAREVLEALEASTPQLADPSTVDQATLTEIRRAFHTLKGSGRTVGAVSIGELAWAVEQLLNRCLDGAMTLSEAIGAVVRDAVTMLPQAVDAFANGQKESDDDADALRIRANAVLHGPRTGDQANNPAFLDPDLYRVFYDDAKGHLATWRERVGAPSDGTVTIVDESLVRALHTLTGSAGALAIHDIAALTGALEAICLHARHTGELPPEQQDLLARSMEAVTHRISPADLAAGAAAHVEFDLPALIDEARAAQAAQAAQADASNNVGHPGSAALVAATDVAADHLDAAETALGQWRGGDSSARAALLAAANQLSEQNRQSGFDELVYASTQLVENIEQTTEGGAPDTGWMDAAVARIEQCRQMLDARREGGEMVLTEFSDTPHTDTGSDHPADTAAPAPPQATKEDRNAELLALFAADARDQLEGLATDVDALAQTPSSQQQQRALLGRLHTLKGGARTAGAVALGGLCHDLESVLERLTLLAAPDAATHDDAQGLQDGLALLGEGLESASDLADAYERQAPATVRTDVQSRLDDFVSRYPDLPPADAPAIIAVPEPSATAPQQPSTVAASPAPDQDASGVDTELLEIFVGEAQELLDGFRSDLEQLRGDQPPAAILDNIRRMLHTLKGGARMAGLEELGDASHALESELERPEHAAQASPDLMARLENSLDAFAQRVDDAERSAKTAGSPPPDKPISPPDEPAERAEEAAPDLAHMPTASAASDVAPDTWDEALFWQPPSRDSDRLATRRETARVTVEQLEIMLNQAGEVGIAHSRLEQQNSGFGTQLREMNSTVARLRQQLRELDSETDAQIQSRTAAGGGSDGDGQAAADRYAEEFDPLEMDRYTRMQELSRALSESVSDLANLHDSMDTLLADSASLMQTQGRMHTGMQQGLMSTLMVPFSRQVPRLTRVVKQASGESEQDAQIEFHGTEAEMDRNVLERMTAPLEHLLRNAVVHGVEPADARESAGKPAQGTISVLLKREGTQLAIEVTDDGRGLDLLKIRDKAIALDLLEQDADVSDEVLAQMIFQPGFSTADALTQTAGRGIGMDVVAAEVSALGGTVDVRSEFGKGVAFLIRLPLSLAISRALLVSVSGETYAVPIGSVEAISRVPVTSLAESDQPVLDYGGEDYQVRRFSSAVQLPPGQDPDTGHVPVVLARYAEGLSGNVQRMALIVDDMLGTREIVSKPVGAQVGAIDGVAGATIMPDGRVVLILDLPALLQSRRQVLDGGLHDPADVPEDEDRPTQVMVIDDSVTMRRVAERLLGRNGFDVETAKDGMDAMGQLQTAQPDVVLLDIEMPRVDGFEVATFIRSDARLKDVPIIMITSRSGDKHRERAKRIGVNSYLIKPYQEAQLMGEIAAVMNPHAQERAE